MLYINLQEQRDRQLLEGNNIPADSFEQMLSVVNQANHSYYHLSENHQHFHKMLSSSDMMLQKYLPYRDMSKKDKQEWAKIKDCKAGDRGYINRFLINELKQVVPDICHELIEQRLAAQANSSQTMFLELSDDIDTLLLSSSIPAYFEYMEELTVYKKGIFNPVRRGYISFLQIKALHLISQFLKAFEQDLAILEIALLSGSHLKTWSRMGDLIGQICERSDPNHHDPLSLHANNCLRSIYISIYNIAMGLLMSNAYVPFEIRQVLPIIPDRIDFSKTELEEDGAWKRYGDHHFLFMQMPENQKIRLGKCLGGLSAIDRISWMGCLGKEEIRALVMPMITRPNNLENMASTCREVSSEDKNFPFTSRVWDVLNEIYKKHLKENSLTSGRIHQLFNLSIKAKPSIAAQAVESEEADLSAIRNLSFLVIDDSDRIRKMTIKVLRDAGITRISESVNGAEAWLFLQKQQVDVVLCDWIMPELTGIELVKRVMQVESIARRTTFLMLTTVDNKASIVEALSVGVRGYLIKPFSRKQLLEKVYFATEWLRKEQISFEKTRLEEQTLPATVSGAAE